MLPSREERFDSTAEWFSDWVDRRSLTASR
jgi:hypothetical protein